MTQLRDEYARALLRRLEAHEGPVADAERYMERLDVLAGVDLAQKQLAPVVETPLSSEERPPVEHGSGEADGGVSTVEAATAFGEPDPLPAEHEATQQANRPPHEAAAPESDEAEVAEPPASPESVESADKKRAENRCVDCQQVIAPQATRCRPCSSKARRHNPSTWNGARRPVDITKDTQPPTVDAAPKLGTWTLGEPQVDNAAPEVEEPAPVDSQTAPSNSRDAVRHDVTRSVIENPARGLAAVSANPPVAAPSKLVCACPDWWREKTAGWREDIPNEGHHDDCALYRKGGHRWPIPQQGGEVKEPVTLRCEWCMETREFDRFGAVWERSERNPAGVGTVPA